MTQTNKDTDCFAVKARSGEYYCGYNVWDTQIRKAKLYHQYKMAEAMRDDDGFIEKEAHIVRVSIFETCEAEYD